MLKEIMKMGKESENVTVAESNEPVASNIERVISEKGLKKLAVAEKAGYAPNLLSSMLRGRKMIKPCDIVKIADALGVSPGELFKKGDE